jgi:hypothetical protein
MHMILFLRQIESFGILPEIDHAWTHCPLGPQRIAGRDGRIDCCDRLVGQVELAGASLLTNCAA